MLGRELVNYKQLMLRRGATLKAGRQLSELGNSSAALADVIQESTAFIAACYGYEEAATMSDVRFKMWKVKTAKANIVSAPQFMSVPQNLEIC